MKPLFSHSYTDRTPCIFVPFVCARVYVSEWFWFWVSLLVRCFFPFDMMSTWWRLSLAMDKLQWSLFLVIVTLIGHHVFLFHLCVYFCSIYVCVCEWVREILVLGFTTSEVFSPLTLMSTWWRLSLAMDKLQWSLFFVIVTLIGHNVFLFHLCTRVCVSERYYGFGFPH